MRAGGNGGHWAAWGKTHFLDRSSPVFLQALVQLRETLMIMWCGQSMIACTQLRAGHGFAIAARIMHGGHTRWGRALCSLWLLSPTHNKQLEIITVALNQGNLMCCRCLLPREMCPCQCQPTLLGGMVSINPNNTARSPLIARFPYTPFILMLTLWGKRQRALLLAVGIALLLRGTLCISDLLPAGLGASAICEALPASDCNLHYLGRSGVVR